MNIDDIKSLLEKCPLVEGVSIQGDDQVVFHVIVDDPEDREECYTKCAIVDKFLSSLGIDEERIQYNDCEGYENEGSVMC
jgi:hypothetical protein